jgi:hypothetical protein
VDGRPPGYPTVVQFRPWTRLGVVGVAGHLGYELVSGVGVPLASRVGATAATAGYAVSSLAAYWSAGQLASPRGDRAFALANGLFLSAAVSHFTSWPRTTRAGMPWLVECEGLEGRLMGPYNALLYVSAAAAVGGAIENRRAWTWFVLTPVLVVPLLRRETPREYQRLLDQAARRPRWWNRRLAARSRREVSSS